MSRIVRIASVGVGLLLVASCAAAEPRTAEGNSQTYTSAQARFELEPVVSDLAHAWAFAFLPDGDILITQRSGRLWLFDGAGIQEVTNLPPVRPNGQGGLLDIVLHPNYARNGWIYMSYSAQYDGGFGTAVARARLDGTALRDVQEIFRMNNPTSGGRHFGSRLLFDNDRHLYITIGDRGQRERAQDPNDHAGTLIRLRADGSIPQSNPFGGSTDGDEAVFSYGHRNAQGIALHPQTGAVWLHEHGPQGGDEVNIAEAGDNHGWPTITYGVNYGTGTSIGEGTEAPGMEQPVTYWSPSIAPSGMAFYTGSMFPEWQDDLFVGALAGTHLRRLELQGDQVVEQEVLLDGVIGRVRDVREGPDGALYVLTDADSGALYRLVAVR
ncbi:MAG: PQQ-dependent sugar dehydrogenase [Spirochaetota bacterium]